MNDSQKYIYLLIPLMVVIAIYFFKKEEPPPPEAPNIPVKSSPSTPPEEKASPSKVDPLVEKKTAAPTDYVEFEMVDGFAVAFGDILLGRPEDGEQLKRGKFKPPRPRVWKSNEIPYAIDPKLPKKNRVEQAIAYFESKTPIRFVEFDGQEDAIFFTTGSKHCYSFLGRMGGHQPITLSNKCGTHEVMHEIMHSLGFIHEHSRTDRDEFIEVVEENVDPDYLLQFAMVPEIMMELIKGSPFDFDSIMMYPPEAFTIEKGKPTLKAKKGNSISPARNALSRFDLERINDIYGD